jgi:hypothetical protein
MCTDIPEKEVLKRLKERMGCYRCIYSTTWKSAYSELAVLKFMLQITEAPEAVGDLKI